jgi:hypothetical protein
MTLSKNKPATRLSLESFKSTAAAVSVKEQVHMITGGALAACHPGLTA